MSDLLRALAFAYRRKGADVLPGGDLRLLLAYDLRWFAPEDAKKVVARAVELGLLREEGEGLLRPDFDPAKVDIPLNFRPTLGVLEDEAPANVPPPPARAAPSAPVPSAPARDAQVEVERARRGGLLGPEVAALVVARRAGEDVTPRLGEAEARLLKG